MPGFVILGVVILNLALWSPYSAMAFTVAKGMAVQQGAPSKASPETAQDTVSSLSPPSVQQEVVNIVVDKIEEGAIYSKEGRKFEIPFAKVIDNSHSVTKMRTAELIFENGTLVTVVLK